MGRSKSWIVCNGKTVWTKPHGKPRPPGTVSVMVHLDAETNEQMNLYAKVKYGGSKSKAAAFLLGEALTVELDDLRGADASGQFGNEGNKR